MSLIICKSDEAFVCVQKILMPVQKKYLVNFIILFGFFFFAKVLLDVPEISPIWERYSDPSDYLIQSEKDFFSTDFFAPRPGKWLTPRPFTVPLMYKIAGSEPNRMVMFQKLFYCFCVFAFILALLRFLKNAYLKILAAFIFLFYFTWWAIVGWSNNILSESISLSYFILWLAMVMAYYRNRNTLKLILLMLISILLSFTRDTWPYLILFFFLMMLILDFVLKRKKRGASISLVLFSIVLFAFQSYTVNVGERSVLPVFNNLAGRIAQNDEHLNWFKERGMPQAEQLQKDFKGIHVDSYEGKSVIYIRYNDSTYTELFKWVRLNGKSMYQKFLFTHFKYFILNDQSLEQLRRIFAYNTYAYYLPPYQFFHNANNVFPIFNVYVGLIFVFMCIYFWYKNREFYLLLPAIFSLILFANVYLSYNADTMEVERHLYLTTIGIELISMLSLVFIGNYAANEWLTKKE